MVKKTSLQDYFELRNICNYVPDKTRFFTLDDSVMAYPSYLERQYFFFIKGESNGVF